MKLEFGVAELQAEHIQSGGRRDAAVMFDFTVTAQHLGNLQPGIRAAVSGSPHNRPHTRRPQIDPAQRLDEAFPDRRVAVQCRAARRSPVLRMKRSIRRSRPASSVSAHRGRYQAVVEMGRAVATAVKRPVTTAPASCRTASRRSDSPADRRLKRRLCDGLVDVVRPPAARRGCPCGRTTTGCRAHDRAVARACGGRPQRSPAGPLPRSRAPAGSRLPTRQRPVRRRVEVQPCSAEASADGGRRKRVSPRQDCRPIAISRGHDDDLCTRPHPPSEPRTLAARRTLDTSVYGRRVRQTSAHTDRGRVATSAAVM